MNDEGKPQGLSIIHQHVIYLSSLIQSRGRITDTLTIVALRQPQSLCPSSVHKALQEASWVCVSAQCRDADPNQGAVPPTKTK